MTKDSLVAINILCDHKLLNPKNTPILFYWNGSGDLLTTIIQSEHFNNIIHEKCLDIKIFDKAILSYFYFKDENEEYTEFETKIQDIIDIDSNLSYKYIIDICLKLYKISMKKEFENNKNLSDDTIIKHIFTEIKSKYKDKFNNESFINYIRSEIQNQYNINQHNLDIIINTYLKNIVYDN